MATIIFRGTVLYAPQGVIGSRAAPSVKLRVFADRGTGGRSRPVWTGETDREGRFVARFRDELSLNRMAPSLRGRLGRRMVERTRYIVELTQGEEKARLPLDPGVELQRLVLPWAPTAPLTVVLRPVKEAGPEFEKIEREDLDQLLEISGGRVLGTRPNKKAVRAAERAAEMDRKLFAETFKEKKRILKGLENEKSRDIAPRIEIKKDSKSSKVALLSYSTMVRDMVMIAAELNTKEGQIRRYKELFNSAEMRFKELSPEQQRRLRRFFRKWLNPDEMIEATFDGVITAIDEIADDIVENFPPLIPAQGSNRPATCGGEEGTGFGGDSGGNATVNPDGLLENCDWALKNYTTCVRDQGGRGTCTAFGIVAGAECLIAADFGRYVNLSEQDLYMHQKLKWFPFPPDWYGDGYNAVYSTILQSLGRTYVFPFERDWDYNKSEDRIEDDDDREYTNSCLGYAGEACSDTNHQADLVACYSADLTTVETVVTEVCDWVESAVSNIPLIGGLLSDVVGEWVCETITEVIETVEQIEICVYDTDIAGTSGFEIRTATPIWIPMPWSRNINWNSVKALLDARRPIVFCHEVAESFDDQSGGFVTFNGGGEESRGGHCVLITGYVDNADLPAGAPAGAGGGYLVIKNSWGADWADQGFAYLPYDWVREYGTAMIAMHNVRR